MIGRNEKGNLRQSIIPAKKVADEVVFVDTCSTDQTAELALALGAKVFHFEWCDDFSTAKNFVMDQTRHEWILNMDCDESLDVRQVRITIPIAAEGCGQKAHEVSSH